MADTSGTLKSIERLKREKRNAKTRLTRERNKLYELLSTTKASKNTIRRYISKIKSEFLIIEKLLNKMFIFESIPESETEVEKIERETDEIGNQVDVIIEAAETHLRERLEGGELESIAPSGSTHSEYEIQQSEIEAANKRVLTLQAEENQKEEELHRKAVELELAKQRTDEARKIVCIIDARSHNTIPKTAHDSDETCSHSQLPQQVPSHLQPQQTLYPSTPPPETHPGHLQPQQTLYPSTPPPETHPGHLQPQQTLYPSTPPPETHPGHLQPQQTLYPSTPPSETHPGHLQPQQTLYPSTPPPETHPSHLQPQQTLDPSAAAFTSSQSPQRPIPDPDLSDQGLSSQGHPAQFPWQQTSKPVLNRYNPNTYQLHTQLPPPVLDSMSRYIPRQQPRIPYTWQPSPAAPSSKTPTSHRVGPIKLKGVDLPTFDGEDKVEYEQWKAAFTSAVDYADIPVNEKMLRLQNSLKGKALKLVKDLGFSSNAYERAKQKLEKKYGGQRRLQIKTLTALKNWKKVQSKNLNDLEEFLTVLDRTLITLKDTCEKQGDLFGQSLNLISKEKLPEEDVQCYKSWLIEHSKEDTFETLVEWVELRVQIMEEAKEETKGLGTSKERNGDQRTNRGRRERGFNTMSKGNLKCVVQTCKNNHPPWTCDAFKALSVSNRKALIEKSRRCYRCLGVGHKAIECTRARRCGVDGCDSTQHNRLLHTPRRLDQNCQNGSHSVTPQQAMKDSSQQTRSRLSDDKDT